MPLEGQPAHATAQAQRETWERLIDRQRRENDGLRSAMRYRAVIEQAKGVLMARSGSDPETAFRHLVAHSQRTNLKLTQVAAAVVARTITTPPAVGGQPPTDRQLLEAATGDAAVRHLAAAAVVSAPDLQELLRTVVQHTQRWGVTAGSLALAEPDGALRLAGIHGTQEQAVSGWRRIPPGTDIPMCAAADGRAPLWIENAAERMRRFPGSSRYPGHREGCAVIPLMVEQQLVGVLSLDWDTPYAFDDAVRSHLLAVAELCSAPIADLLRRYDEPLPGVDFEPGYAGWFRAFLDGLFSAAAILRPQFEADRIVDLEVLFVNRAGMDHQATMASGKSLLELQPELVEGPFLDQAEAVMATGGAYERAVTQAVSTEHGEKHVVELHLFRVGSLLTLIWDQPRS